MNKADAEKIMESNVLFKSSEHIPEVPDDSIQAIITSPPYWNLKNYGHSSQIGLNESYEEYHQRMNLIWKECFRVLKPNGTLWIVIDKIWREGQVIPIPFDIAENCSKIGFSCKDIIIWNKPTAIAGLNNRNLVNKNEYVLFLVKDNKKFFINLNENPEGMAPDYIESKLTNLWRIPVKAGNLRKTPNHEAPYPVELISRIIKISSKEGDLILDPFLGSGTTLEVAISENRNCIGVEINPDFREMIVSRLLRIPNQLWQKKLQK